MRYPNAYDSKVTYVILVLACFHSALCPFFYAFNFKDFQTAFRKVLEIKLNLEFSVPNRMTRLQQRENKIDLSYTYSCSEDANNNEN